jgi:hypothetical protein
VTQCFWHRYDYASLTIPTTLSSASITTEWESLTILEEMIQLVWQESDRVAHNTANTQDVSPANEHNTSSTPTSHPHHGLSKSAKIAIGVVVPVVVIAAFVGALLYFRRLHQKRLDREKNIRELDVGH